MFNPQQTEDMHRWRIRMEDERQTVLVLTLFCVLLGSAYSQPNVSFEDKLSTVNQALRTTFNEATSVTELINIYNQSLWNTTVITVNGTQVAQEIAAEVDRDFKIITSSLQNNTNIGVELYEENYNTSCCSQICRRHSVHYNRDECFNATTVCNKTATNASYYHATDDRTQLPPLAFNQFIGDSVNFSHSGIHVPLPVDKLDEPVLCFAQWTNGLTDVLRRNFESLTQRDHYPQLIGVQFFGGNSSAVLYYPLYAYVLTKDPMRCPFDPVDTYNAKSRQWYVNTISGSKHVVILLDISGSMFELSSSLARLAATELIFTLSGNDFFYVLGVNDQPSPFGGCFTNRTIASPENKAAMNHLLQTTRLHKGIANFDLGLELGLENLKDSTSCHKLIVIMSDGHVNIDLDLFKARAAGTDVRVFSYIVGNHGSDQPLKALSCQNRGIVKRIHSYNDVVTNVHAFTEELNRLVNSTNAPLRSIGDYFNEQFIDSIDSDILVTISQPLRAKVGGREGFVGVMGLDILGQNIRRRLNARRLGNLGYGFIANNNAQLLSHPILRGISTVSIYTFNLHDYEFALANQTVQLNNLRRKLVSLVTEQQQMLSFIPVDGQIRYLLEDVTYYMVPLTNVTFSLALKLPSSGVSLPSYPSLTSSQLALLLDLLPDIPGEVILQSNKSYCADINYTNENNSRNFLMEILNRTLMNTSVGDCVEELVTPLLGDLYYLNQSNAIGHWIDYLNSTNNTSILGLFIQLSSGLQWCVWKEGVAHGVNCTDLAVINYIALSEHIVVDDDDLAVFAGPSQTMVTVQQLLLKVPSINASLGVVGMVTSHSFLDQTPAEPNMIDYFIDRDGYIAESQGGATNETFGIYRFFGLEQPQIFEDLIRMGVVKRDSVVGYVTKLCDSTSSQLDTCSDQSDNCCASRALCVSEVSFYNILRTMCAGGHWTFTAEKCPELTYHFGCIPGTTLFAISVENRNFSQTCNSTHFPVSLQSHPLPCPCNNSNPIRMPPDEQCPDILSSYIPTEECSSGQVPILSVFTQRYMIPILSLAAIIITSILFTNDY